jgi:hypothetical protein
MKPEQIEQEKEEVAKVIYGAMRKTAIECGMAAPVWVERGNSMRQDDARRAADKIMDLYSAPPRPAVSLPEDMNWPMVSECLRNYAHALESGELDGAGHYEPMDIYEQDELIDSWLDQSPPTERS